MKLCSCGNEVSRGSKTRCKSCDAEYKWYWNQKKRFNLSREKLDNMCQAQNNCCKICNKPFEGQRPCVDHCHTSGVVRGLLCSYCNKGLGHFFDNTENLLNAIKYLNEPLSETTKS